MSTNPNTKTYWRRISRMARELLDLWTEERNTYAKEVMKDIEDQRREAAR